MPSLQVYTVTFNCGRALVDVNAFAQSFFDLYGNKPDHVNLPALIVLSLQEIAPLAYSFLGGSFLSPYFACIAKSIQQAASPHLSYHHLVTHNVGMTGIMLLAEPETFAKIRWIETAAVGVGKWEMGNKGAAGVRLGYAANASDEPAILTFVAAHLAAGEQAFERRNADWKNIVKGLVFTPRNSSTKKSFFEDNPEGDSGESDALLPAANSDSTYSIGPTGMFTSRSPLFFAGDLNYRISDTAPSPDDHVFFPQPTKDEADPKHYSHRLSTDQLLRELKAGKTLHHLSEADIHFPPTYKFSSEQQQIASESVGNELDPRVWHWAKHRYPSWCDRILFSSFLSGSSSPLKIIKYSALPIQPSSDHRPVALAFELDIDPASATINVVEPAYSSPFPLNPHWKEQHTAARRKEVAVGVLAYLALTWEGNALLFATLIGAVGGWLVMRSLVGA